MQSIGHRSAERTKHRLEKIMVKLSIAEIVNAIPTPAPPNINNGSGKLDLFRYAIPKTMASNAGTSKLNCSDTNQAATAPTTIIAIISPIENCGGRVMKYSCASLQLVLRSKIQFVSLTFAKISACLHCPTPPRVL